MSRSGYTDDFDDNLALGRWRQAVRRALEGRRGQAFLRETLEALDALTVKELAAESLQPTPGSYCTLGAVGARRGIYMAELDPDDSEQVAKTFGIADAMVREIVYENDEQGWDFIEIPWVQRNCWDHPPRVRYHETPAERWTRMRKWVVDHIKSEEPRHDR